MKKQNDFSVIEKACKPLGYDPIEVFRICRKMTQILNKKD